MKREQQTCTAAKGKRGEEGDDKRGKKKRKKKKKNDINKGEEWRHEENVTQRRKRSMQRQNDREDGPTKIIRKKNTKT